MSKHTAIIKQTQAWLTSFIIQHNICPFAARVHNNNSIHYNVIDSNDTTQCLQTLFNECQLLDRETALATSLLIYPNHFPQFSNYLDFLELAEELLYEQGYEGIYQLASFHPHYCFADAPATDPANYTNRSPYPMLHLIREEDLEHALQNYPEPEKIPQRNIVLTRSLGNKALQDLLRQISEIQ